METAKSCTTLCTSQHNRRLWLETFLCTDAGSLVAMKKVMVAPQRWEASSVCLSLKAQPGNSLHVSVVLSNPTCFLSTLVYSEGRLTMIKHVHLRIHTWKQERLKLQPGDGMRSDHTEEHLGGLLHKDSFCVWDGEHMCVYSSMYCIFVYVWVCMFTSVHVCWGQSMISSIISQKLTTLCFETQSLPGI